MTFINGINLAERDHSRLGTAVTCRPPAKSVRAELPHTAPALGT